MADDPARDIGMATLIALGATWGLLLEKGVVEDGELFAMVDACTHHPAVGTWGQAGLTQALELARSAQLDETPDA